jgi:hypothetical protein
LVPSFQEIDGKEKQPDEGQEMKLVYEWFLSPKRSKLPSSEDADS